MFLQLGTFLSVETLILWQPNRAKRERAAAKEPTELFTKNTGLC